MICALCPFPCPEGDALPLAGGVVHACCALEATKRLGVRAAVLLKRRVSVRKPKEVSRA